MLQYDFQNSLGYWICNTARTFERAMTARLLPQGITHRQCQVLAWLALEGELSQVDLADRMSIEPPTLVRILDRMERDGLISRESCASDRRKKMIRPLPKAKPLWKKITTCGEEVRTQAAEGLSSSQREQLRELLSHVRVNLGSEEAATASESQAAPRPRKSPPADRRRRATPASR